MTSRTSLTLIFSLAAAGALLSGCAPLIVGGAAVTAVAVAVPKGPKVPIVVLTSP